jgi:hypothetical protein
MQGEFNLTFKNTLDEIINEALPQILSRNDLYTNNLLERVLNEQTL